MAEDNTMSELKTRFHDETSGLDYVLVGDYYIPVIELPESDDRPIGKWGRVHRAYLEETNPFLLNHLILTGKLHAYLADLNEQAQSRYRHLVHQMAENEGVTEDMKRKAQWEWIRSMNSIASRAEEIVKSEIINT
jgi:formamidopyrimidine-DNA glycosylase